MKKLLIIIVGTILIMASNSCKKKTSYPKVSPPQWEVSEPTGYSSSMTVVVTVPKQLISSQSDGVDQISAFINGECRGVGTAVETDTTGKEFFVMIYGNTAENGGIAFKYYCAHKSRMYGTGVLLPFNADGTYGSVDRPEILDFHPVK